MYYYPIAKNQLDTSKAERRALYSPQEFARMIIGVDPPVEEMSFKPKMDNISVFKKGNALMSYAAMPSDKTYALNAVGWAKQMALTHVSLFCYTHPWEEKEEGWYEWGCKISGYNEGSLVEVYWDINGRLN